MTETVQRNPSCESDFDPNALPVSQALERIQQIVNPISHIVTVNLHKGLNRVLAENIPSPFNVPNHTNSAMDGYAIRHEDIEDAPFTQLNVVGTSYAGLAYTDELHSGQAVRIMTGAVMPTTCDTVIMQEDVETISDQVIRIDQNHKKGQHVRYAGESLKQGETAVCAGHRLNPADIGLIASLGVTEFKCFKKPTVAFFATGDEVKPVGKPLKHGEVYDSNRYTLATMLSKLNVDILDLGIIPDDPEITKRTFQSASAMADAIIVSGGASVGEADYVRSTLKELGEVSFWKLAMKPGRPLAFGKLDNAIFFGLPGNPVSVMVTFYQFVLPAIKRLMGETDTRPNRFRVPCVTELKKRPGRTEYQRGVLFYDSDHILKVKSTGQQGSGILSSMSQGDCFIVLAEDNTGVAVGNLVDVEPFFGLL